MRDRLIGLLIKSGVTWNPCGVADCLLASGVIVSPCKVGQMVYVMEDEFTGFWECQIISIQYDGVQWLGYMNCLWAHHHGGFWKWQECDIGKTVFLTRKEAEQAIAERGKE